MMFVTKVIVFLCFSIACFSYYRIRNISSDLIEYTDTGFIFFQKGGRSVLFYVMLLCPMASIFLYGLFQDLEFLPFCVLLIYAIFLFEHHKNAQAAILSEETDMSPALLFASCIFFIAFYSDKNREQFYIVILSYLIVYSWHIIGKMDAYEKLFYHYLSKSKELEAKNEEIKKELIHHETKIERLQNDLAKITDKKTMLEEENRKMLDYEWKYKIAEKQIYSLKEELWYYKQYKNEPGD